MKNAVVIIPTYNEKNNIVTLISILETKIFPKIKSYSMHILVADDSSPDGTAQAVRKLMKKWTNINLDVGEKEGLGAAYLRAMQYATEKMKAQVLIGMDGDLSHDPTNLPLFLEAIDHGYDIVVATRYSQGGSIPVSWGLHRKCMSIGGNLLIRSVLGRPSIHDWTGAYRAMKKEVFIKEKDKLLSVKGYTFLITFLHKALQDGFTVTEIPIQFVDRIEGKSKILPREYMSEALQYIFTARIKELFGKKRGLVYDNRVK